MRAGATVGTVEWRKQHPPQFEDFPVRDFYKGRPAAVDLSSNTLARSYRTRLRKGAKKGPNFAGHYTIVDWGCGSNCQVYAVVDAHTGKVYQTNGGERGASFTVGGSLFIGDPPDPPIGPYPDDPVESLPARYYVWRNNKFILIYEQACSVVDGSQKCGCEEAWRLMQEPSTK